eukprot:Phypoly_transcript_22237.p1 GENE.Phypoly_transcript_22237~~Phypoly_transcript_22237.p1  ORF type:complete len:119 (+),score=12.31 Phypoly_transcript_22237:213-569(+)
MRGTILILLVAIIVSAYAVTFHTYTSDDCTGHSVDLSIDFGKCFGCCGGSATTTQTGNTLNFCEYSDSNCQTQKGNCSTWTINTCHSEAGLSYKVTNSATQATTGVFFVAVTLAALFF